MKQMICLLSEQLVPTYLAIQHYRPQRVWRILTEKTLQEGRDRLLCEELARNAAYAPELPDCSGLIAKPTHYTSTHKIITRLIEKQGGDHEWLINVTGGNKMMAIGAAIAGTQHPNVSLIYTDIEQPDAFINAQTGVAERWSGHLSLDEFLKLYGFRSEDKSVRYDAQWTALAREFAQSPPLRAPFSLTGDAHKRAEHAGLKNYASQLHRDFPAPLIDQLNAVLTATGGNASELSGGGYQFMQGLWLEVFMHDVVSKYAADLGLHDIRQGLNIHHDGGESNLDTAFMRGLDFCYIECKSGAQAAKSGNDQIEETAGTLSRIRALRAKALIATTGANLVDDRGRLADGAKARLGEARMNIMTRRQIIALANAYDNKELAVSILNNFIGGRP